MRQIHNADSLIRASSITRIPPFGALVVLDRTGLEEPVLGIETTASREYRLALQGDRKGQSSACSRVRKLIRTKLATARTIVMAKKVTKATG